MQRIGGALTELVGVFLAGIVFFFALLIYAVGFVVLLVAGAACAAFLVVALCCTGWWFYTHDHHAGVTALGFYGYAAGTFALMGLVFYYHGKAADGLKARQVPRAKRNSRDVSFFEP